MILNNQIDSERVKLFKQKFNVVIIDEVSMISNDAKHDLIHKLKDLKLVFCGDLGFQLPPINGEYMIFVGSPGRNMSSFRSPSSKFIAVVCVPKACHGARA